MISRTIVFGLFFVAALFSTPLFAVEMGAETRKLLSDIEMRVHGRLRSYRQLPQEQQFLATTVSLSEQRQKGVVASNLDKGSARSPGANRHFFFRDDFERMFPAPFWQIVSNAPAAAWRLTNKNSMSGNHSVTSGASPDSSKHDGQDQLQVSWLVAGPFDSSDLDDPALNFYYSKSNEGVFFWGISTDGDRFHGVGTASASGGWQFVNERLRDNNAFTRASQQVWIGFMYASRTSAEARVYLDRAILHLAPAWQQEFGAQVNGAFHPNAYTGGFGLSRPAFVDIDNDGDQDMFVGTYEGTLRFFRNEGSKSNPHLRLADGDYASIDVGENSSPAFMDYDGDGDADMILGDYDGNLILYRNDSEGHRTIWQYAGLLQDSAGRGIKVKGSAAPAFHDIDGDGDLDLTIGDIEGQLAVYKNVSPHEKPEWELASEKYFGIDVGSLAFPAWHDYDDDGDPDLFVGNQERSVYLYENEGSVREPRFTLASKEFASISVKQVTAPAFVDIDDDGDADMVIGQAAGDISLIRNTGSRSDADYSSEPESLPLQTLDVDFESAPALADLDADGDLDLVIGANDGQFHFYRNDGDARIPDWRHVAAYFDSIQVKNWSTPAFVDIDADGDLDLFSGSKLGPISFFENQGNQFQPRFEPTPSALDTSFIDTQTYPAFVDIDADGDQDMFVGTALKGIAFFRNIGTAHQPEWKLADANILKTGSLFRMAPAFVDVDQDGDYDLFVGLNSGAIQFYENTGNRRRPEWRRRTTEFLGIDVRSFSAPAFSDLDGDRDPDLLLGNNSGGLLFWRNLAREHSFIDTKPDLVKRLEIQQALRTRLPTPYAPGHTIAYHSSQPLPVSIRIYDRDGELVKTLLDQTRPADNYHAAWDGRDKQGNPMPAGLYFLKIRQGRHTHFHKLVYHD